MENTNLPVPRSRAWAEARDSRGRGRHNRWAEAVVTALAGIAAGLPTIAVSNPLLGVLVGALAGALGYAAMRTGETWFHRRFTVPRDMWKERAKRLEASMPRLNIALHAPHVLLDRVGTGSYADIVRFSLMGVRVTNRSQNHSVALTFHWRFDLGRHEGFARIIEKVDVDYHATNSELQFHSGTLNMEAESAADIHLSTVPHGPFQEFLQGNWLDQLGLFIKVEDSISGEEREFRVPTNVKWAERA